MSERSPLFFFIIFYFIHAHSVFIVDARKSHNTTYNIKKKPKDEDQNVFCDLVGFSKDTLKKIQAIIHRGNIKWRDLNYPALDNPSPRIRALVAISQGCDVWPGGIPGIGYTACPRILEKVIEDGGEEAPDIVDRFIDGLLQESEDKTITKEILLTLCDAFLCEPVVSENEEYSGENMMYKYCYGNPQELSKYLSYFKCPTKDNTKIVDGPAFRICNGIFGVTEPHQYLDAEPT